METISKSTLSIDELIENIKNAFHKADKNDTYCDKYIYAVKPEKGQVIITIREVEAKIADTELKSKLEKFFPHNSYSYDIDYQKPNLMVIINKKSVM